LGQRRLPDRIGVGGGKAELGDTSTSSTLGVCGVDGAHDRADQGVGSVGIESAVEFGQHGG
jgi:hypothetical protein